MSVIKASELVYCRVRVPDLEEGERFLVDFGLIVAHREAGRFYFRASNSQPYCYILEQGMACFRGFAVQAKSADDLQTLSVFSGSPVEVIDAPGGGLRITLTEPNGYPIDVVHGIEPVEPIAVQRQETNTAREPLRRAGVLYRPLRGQATPVRRLAHAVLATQKVAETKRWFETVLGFIPSDNITAGPEKELVGSFMRADCGDDYVDHHSLFLVANDQTGLHHLSFESQDIDAVLSDHFHLRGLKRYEHMRGVGRHLLGSQIYDYWKDTFGFVHEHWADSDRLNASAPTGEWDVREGFVNQWGDAAPSKLRYAVHP